MSKEETTRKIEQEIDHGDLGKARDRLHGLVRTYPEDMDIRDRLGEILWQLQYPAAAGQWWYLLPRDTEPRRIACAAFEARYGGDAREIFRRLKAPPSTTPGLPEFTRELLLGLERRFPRRPAPEPATSSAEYGIGFCLVATIIPIAGVFTFLGYLLSKIL